jgi:hypothetical protein
MAELSDFRPTTGGPNCLIPILFRPILTIASRLRSVFATTGTYMRPVWPPVQSSQPFNLSTYQLFNLSTAKRCKKSIESCIICPDNATNFTNNSVLKQKSLLTASQELGNMNNRSVEWHSGQFSCADKILSRSLILLMRILLFFRA